MQTYLLVFQFFTLKHQFTLKMLIKKFLKLNLSEVILDPSRRAPEYALLKALSQVSVDEYIEVVRHRARALFTKYKEKRGTKVFLYLSLDS